MPLSGLKKQWKLILNPSCEIIIFFIYPRLKWNKLSLRSICTQCWETFVNKTKNCSSDTKMIWIKEEQCQTDEWVKKNYYNITYNSNNINKIKIVNHVITLLLRIKLGVISVLLVNYIEL